MNDKIKIVKIIEKSLQMTDLEKKEFIGYLDTLKNNNLAQIAQVFEEKPRELVRFWLGLKVRMLLLQGIDNSDKITRKEKKSLKKNILDMGDEELYACVHTMKSEANTTKDDLDKKTKKLLRAERENHQKFMEMANKVLKKIFKKKVKKMEKNDKQKYEELIAQIKDK